MSCGDIGTTPTPDDDDTRALDDLDRIYGHAYDLAVARSRWMAYELGTGRWLVASCATELRRFIVASSRAARDRTCGPRATGPGGPDRDGPPPRFPAIFRPLCQSRRAWGGQ